MIAYHFTDTGVAVFIDGCPHKINKDSVLYTELLDTFNDELSTSELEEVIKDIVARGDKSLEEAGIDPSGTLFHGVQLPQFLIERVKQLKKEGIPAKMLLPFFKNFSENPSFDLAQLENISEDKFGLYDFLAIKDLPITSDGCFLAYRGIKNDWYSKNGNLETRVLQGKVNNRGQILNSVGSTIEVHRADVNPDRSECAKQGLHIGSLAYAKRWGQKVVLCKVNPKDVVSVPRSENEKCRVCKYEILSEYGDDDGVKGAVVEASKEEIKSVSNSTDDNAKKWSAFMDRIAAYIDVKSLQGYSGIPVKAIQNSFSPDYPPRIKVLAALREMGEFVNEKNVVEL